MQTQGNMPVADLEQSTPGGGSSPHSTVKVVTRNTNHKLVKMKRSRQFFRVWILHTTTKTTNLDLHTRHAVE